MSGWKKPPWAAGVLSKLQPRNASGNSIQCSLKNLWLCQALFFWISLLKKKFPRGAYLSFLDRSPSPSRGLVITHVVMSLQSSWPNCLMLPSGLFLTRSAQYSPKQWASSLQPTAFCSLCKITVTAFYLEWTNDGTFSHITLSGGVDSRVRLAIGLLSVWLYKTCLRKTFRSCLLTGSCWSVHLYKLNTN